MQKTQKALKTAYHKLMQKKDLLKALKITLLLTIPNILMMKYIGPKNEDMMLIADNIINFLLLPTAGIFVMLPVIYFCKQFTLEFRKTI